MWLAVSKPSMFGICASSRMTAKSSTSSCLSAASPLSTATACTGRPWRIASRAMRLSLRSSTSSALAVSATPVSLVGVHPAGHELDQLVQVDRLRDVVGGTRGERGLAVTRHRLGREEHYRQVGEAVIAADASGGLVPVLIGHHGVHQDDVDLRVLGEHPDAVDAVVRVEHPHPVQF